MILSEIGEVFQDGNAKYIVGGKVYANESSDYRGLYGFITEIRTDDDKETENETPDIYCDFEAPENPEDVLELEKRFSELYNEKKKIDEIYLGNVIMSPEEITPIPESEGV